MKSSSDNVTTLSNNQTEFAAQIANSKTVFAKVFSSGKKNNVRKAIEYLTHHDSADEIKFVFGLIKKPQDRMEILQNSFGKDWVSRNSASDVLKIFSYLHEIRDQIGTDPQFRIANHLLQNHQIDVNTFTTIMHFCKINTGSVYFSNYGTLLDSWLFKQSSATKVAIDTRSFDDMLQALTLLLTAEYSLSNRRNDDSAIPVISTPYLTRPTSTVENLCSVLTLVNSDQVKISLLNSWLRNSPRDWKKNLKNVKTLERNLDTTQINTIAEHFTDRANAIIIMATGSKTNAKTFNIIEQLIKDPLTSENGHKVYHTMRLFLNEPTTDLASFKRVMHLMQNLSSSQENCDLLTMEYLVRAENRTISDLAQALPFFSTTHNTHIVSRYLTKPETTVDDLTQIINSLPNSNNSDETKLSLIKLWLEGHDTIEEDKEKILSLCPAPSITTSATNTSRWKMMWDKENIKNNIRNDIEALLPHVEQRKLSSEDFTETLSNNTADSKRWICITRYLKINADRLTAQDIKNILPAVSVSHRHKESILVRDFLLKYNKDTNSHDLKDHITLDDVKILLPYINAEDRVTLPVTLLKKGLQIKDTKQQQDFFNKVLQDFSNNDPQTLKNICTFAVTNGYVNLLRQIENPLQYVEARLVNIAGKKNHITNLFYLLEFVETEEQRNLIHNNTSFQTFDPAAAMFWALSFPLAQSRIPDTKRDMFTKLRNFRDTLVTKFAENNAVQASNNDNNAAADDFVFMDQNTKDANLVVAHLLQDNKLFTMLEGSEAVRKMRFVATKNKAETSTRPIQEFLSQEGVPNLMAEFLIGAHNIDFSPLSSKQQEIANREFQILRSQLDIEPTPHSTNAPFFSAPFKRPHNHNLSNH